MQLHEFVDAVTGDEPPPARSADDIIAAGRRAERRRRAGFASAGAAGLVVVAVAGAFALPSFGGSGRSETPAAPDAAAAPPPQARAAWTDAAPFTFTFKGYAAGKLRVQDPIVASTAYQIASIYADGMESNDRAVPEGEVVDPGKPKGKGDGPVTPTLYAYLTVYRKGAFDPAGIKGGKKLTVDGHEAVQATLPAGLEDGNPGVPGNKLFAWEYTGDAWAVATSVSSSDDTPSFTDLSGLVGGLQPSAPRAARLPFTVGYVPDGYRPLQIGTHAMPGLDGIASARDGDYGGATFVRGAPVTSGLSAPYDQGEDAIKDGFHIFVTPSRNSNQKAQAGQTRCYSGGFCNVWSADGRVQVQVSAQTTGGKVAGTELRKVAESIKVAAVEDESTWTAAADALQP